MILMLTLYSDASCSMFTEANHWPGWIPLISSFVVILLFVIDRVLGFYLRKKEVERNWYLKVLVEPGVQKISEFYSSLVEKYSQSAKLLDSNKGQPHEEYNKLKSKEFGKFQAFKRDLEIQVIYPIQLRYPDVGNDITNQLMDIEDVYTNSLDREKFKSNDIIEFHNYAANNRAQFLEHLYEPLKQKFF